MDLTTPINGVSMDGWFGLFGQMGVVGILVWFLWYATSSLLPKFSDKMDEITKANNEAVKVLTETHNASTEKICESFEQCIREERQVRREDIKELREMFALGTCTKTNCSERRGVQ